MAMVHVTQLVQWYIVTVGTMFKAYFNEIESGVSSATYDTPLSALGTMTLGTRPVPLLQMVTIFTILVTYMHNMHCMYVVNIIVNFSNCLYFYESLSFACITVGCIMHDVYMYVCTMYVVHIFIYFLRYWSRKKLLGSKVV